MSEPHEPAHGELSSASSDRVKALALAVGFDLAGIASAEPSRDTEFLRGWLARGYAGEMTWIERRVQERVDPRRVLPGARSVVALGLVYDAGAPADPQPGLPRVARYAGGEDYHEVLLDRVRAFEAGLAPLLGRPVRTRGYVDTGPVQERVFAARAGLGWVGRNTCVIHPKLGSYLFLAVVLTDLALPADTPEPDHCGSCRACLDACPTDAFPEPYVLDATRCISYTTIESRAGVPEALREPQAAWLFGCDVCQEVCPWNLRERRRVPPDPQGLRARVAPREPWLQPTLAFVLGLDEPRWREATRRTALRRTRYRGLLRNALVAAGNCGDASLEALLRRHAEGDDPMLAEHARWALGRIAARSG